MARYESINEYGTVSGFCTVTTSKNQDGEPILILTHHHPGEVPGVTVAGDFQIIVTPSFDEFKNIRLWVYGGKHI